MSLSEKDNTTGFQNVIYDYQPDGAGKGILKIYLLHGVTTNPIGPNALTDSGINYDLIGQKQIESSDSLALAVSASTGDFRNLQRFRFDSFEYSAVKRLTIDKTWDDNNNANGIRPDTVEVQVWANLKATSNKEEVRLPYKTPIKITSTDNWHYVYDNLPKYNNEGREIFYDVTELPVAGYESTYQRMNDDEVSDIHIEISNKTQNPLNISGEKIWLDEGDTDSRPDHITIQLWRRDNNQERQVKFNELSAGYQSIYGQVNPNDFVTQETNSNKNWEYSFSYLSGTETVAGLEQGIQYFFKEELPGNYKYKYQTQVIGHDIVNTPIEVEKTSLIINKVWEDTGYEKNRPESITVQLYADNIAQGEPTIISANENWTKEFNDLILRDAKGNEISYSVKELNVTEDYQQRQSQEDKKITLINKFVKKEVKPEEKDKQQQNNNSNNKEKESSPNNEEIKKDNVEKETTNSLPIVGQYPEVWMILLGTGDVKSRF